MNGTGEPFADAWRGKYQPFMNRVRTGELPWTNLDALHRMALEEVLAEFEIDGLSEAEKAGSETSSGITCAPGPTRCRACTG